jgi:Flp pilus assembly protein TadD
MARELFAEFVRLVQQRAEVLVNLAQLLFAEGDLDRALLVLAQAYVPHLHP